MEGTTTERGPFSRATVPPSTHDESTPSTPSSTSGWVIVAILAALILGGVALLTSLGKADKDEVKVLKADLGTKAEAAKVADFLATKADKSAVDTALATKADKDTVDEALADKADKDAVDEALATKADKVEVEALDSKVRGKANYGWVRKHLATKADQTAVDDMANRLAGKADKAAAAPAEAPQAEQAASTAPAVTSEIATSKVSGTVEVTVEAAPAPVAREDAPIMKIEVTNVPSPTSAGQ